MELIFLAISFIIALASIYGIGRMIIPSHKRLVELYKRNPELIALHVVMGLLLLFLNITFFASDNTFWKLLYLYT